MTSTSNGGLSRRGFLGLGLSAGMITLTACGSDSDKPSGGDASAELVMTAWGGEPDVGLISAPARSHGGDKSPRRLLGKLAS